MSSAADVSTFNRTANCRWRTRWDGGQQGALSQRCACWLTSVVNDLGAQDGGHLQHSDEGLVHGGEGERGHAVSSGHLGDVHCTVTWTRWETLGLTSPERSNTCPLSSGFGPLSWSHSDFNTTYCPACFKWYLFHYCGLSRQILGDIVGWSVLLFNFI